MTHRWEAGVGSGGQGERLQSEEAFLKFGPLTGMFELCKAFDVQKHPQEGKRLILREGNLGRAYANDRDNLPPYFALPDGGSIPTRGYGLFGSNHARYLEWS